MKDLSEYKHVFTSMIPIRWGDMDAMGHVNNTVYFRFLEQARIEWYTYLGREKNAGVETVIVNAHCSFLKEITYPGTIKVKTYAGKPGRSSFEIVQEIFKVENETETLCAQGGAKVVWVNKETHKSTPLPDLIRNLIA